ncbi:hypothetical protein TNCV_4362221 [Trichonephila clavipes]|nr:hypothetical protein TNCV_4362221 [Trichonephila clavipes]
MPHLKLNGNRNKKFEGTLWTGILRILPEKLPITVEDQRISIKRTHEGTQQCKRALRINVGRAMDIFVRTEWLIWALMEYGHRRTTAVLLYGLPINFDLDNRKTVA